VVIAAVTEAQAILDAIDAAASRYFVASPNSEAHKRYARAMARARLSLSAAMRTAQGAEKLDQQKVDEAFQEFRKAYQDLLAVVGPLGIAAPTKDGAVSLAVAEDGALLVPEPMALKLQLEK